MSTWTVYDDLFVKKQTLLLKKYTLVVNISDVQHTNIQNTFNRPLWIFLSMFLAQQNDIILSIDQGFVNLYENFCSDLKRYYFCILKVLVKQTIKYIHKAYPNQHMQAAKLQLSSDNVQFFYMVNLWCSFVLSWCTHNVSSRIGHSTTSPRKWGEPGFLTIIQEVRCNRRFLRSPLFFI